MICTLVASLALGGVLGIFGVAAITWYAIQPRHRPPPPDRERPPTRGAHR